MTDEAHARRAGALDRILELSVLVNADMTQSLARDQLTVSRAHVLWELRHRGPSTQRVLADAMGVSARTITGLVDGLVATGFVTREPHPTDRRATLVTVTEHGAKITAAMESGQVEFASLLFDEFDAADLDRFVAGMDHVLAKLRAHIDPTAREIQ
ncbi:MarR family transcriptional regulator [Luedemannella flava]|uniref:MarR family transcriptional regulator n=1 Tax=Luedemannella flava TaxID=349316 RepID=A0ABN2MPF0_9ACTN